MGISCTTSKKSKEKPPPTPRDSEHALLDRFGSAQIQMLRTKFKEYEHNGGLDIAGFKKLMPYISKLPNDIIENAFNIFRAYTRDRITWMHFCATVSQYILGSRQEKCRFLYDVFDKKQRGLLSKDELALLNRHLAEVLKAPISGKSNTKNLLNLHANQANAIKFNEFRDWAIENIDLHKALQPFEIIPSAVTEKEIYIKYREEVKSKGLIPGDTYYLISLNWIEAWKNYVRFESFDEDDTNDVSNRHRSTSFKSGARPIEISNNVILDPDCNIKLLSNLRENINFVILCKQAWVDFSKWYGGGPEIPREAIKKNDIISVDIYPPILKVFYKKNLSSSKESIFLLTTHSQTVSTIIEELKKKVEIDGEYFLVLQSGTEYIELDPEKLLNYYKLSEVNICRFELRTENKELSIIDEETMKFSVDDQVEYKENGYWMSGSVRSITQTEYIIGASWHKHTITINKTDIGSLRKPPLLLLGTKNILLSTGIANIGNTCYMNSILQCIAHSPLINQYFTGQVYLDLKRRHTQSSKLKIVEEVENLLNELRLTKELKIRPDRFYVEFTKVYKQFQGFEQHDSHEFLGILLNSLHDDLKYSQVSFNQTLTLKGATHDEERKKSQEQWDKYRGQAGSVISAICGGQTRNCLVCKNCSEKSTIFEVFTDFSIPIPIKQYDISIIVVLIPMQSRNFQKVLINFNRNDEIEAFFSDLQNKISIPVQKLVFAFVRKSYFDEFFQPTSIDEVNPPDENHILYAYEIINTIDEAESMGKKTLAPKVKPSNWRFMLKQGDLLDIKYKKIWKVGKAKEIIHNTISVEIQDRRGQVVIHKLDSEDINYYRQKTENCNKILLLPMFHYKAYRTSQKFFATPLIVSIGTWYRWKDLVKLLYKVCELFVDKKKVIIKKRVQFHLFHKSGRCVECKKKNCTGCVIKSSMENLESLAEIYNDIYILANWTEEYVFRDPYIEDPDGTEVCTIFDCFTKYTEQETVEIVCENCKNNTLDSQVEIWILPDILIIHLKRFSFKNGRLLKINHLVRFPLIGLDMSSCMLNSKKRQGVTMKSTKENCLYDLYAVVNHTGGISGGHYTAFCKADDEKWLFFDDDRVFQVVGNIEEEIVTKKAYILFYRRQRFGSGNVVKTISLY